MKKLRTLFMLAFMFVFMSSFTSGEVNEASVQADSSMTIQLQFDNPRILIDDYRNFQAWAELVRSGVEVDSALIETLTDLGITLIEYIESQERRFESAMDYLTRRTSFNIDEIDNIYETRRKSNIVIVIASSILLLTSFYIAFNRRAGKDRRNNWRRQIAVFLVYSVLFGGYMLLLYYLLLFTTNSDYLYMNQMLNIPG